MKVMLFRDMKAEGWRSMDRYADCLSDELRKASVSVSSFCVEPPIHSSNVKMFWRSSVYPAFAVFNQGNVNHVLDHSYGHLLNFLDPKRTVVTCHDLIPLEYEKDPPSRQRFVDSVECLKKAALIIADSGATKDDLVRKLGVNEAKVEVVYLGVSPVFKVIEGFNPAAARERFNLPEGRLILTHGNSLVYKNIEGSLAAFAQVAERLKGVFLIKSGTPLTEEQRGLALKLGVAEKIVELVNPSDEDLVDLYNLSNVFLLPSFKEGFGLTVLEAMACGLPVIVSQGTSLSEVAGSLGVYVDPANVSGIAKVLTGVLDGGVRRPSGQELAAHARQFTWEKTAERTLAVYRRVYSKN